MPKKNRNKRRRLTVLADIHHEMVAIEDLQHLPPVYSSHTLTASPSKLVTNSMATPSSGNSSPTMSCTINSESSCEAVALLHTQENSFTQDRLNQALMSACRRGHKRLVQTLVRMGANIEHQDENGNTPFLICAEQGFTDIVRFLVSRGANIKAINSTGNTALILSVRPAGSTDLTRLLLEQKNVDIHHENQDGDTALTRATQFMDVDTMRLLLKESMVRNTEAYRKVNVIEYEDSHFFNNMAQSIKQDVISAKAGLKNVYTILKEHLMTRTSPLELAIEAGDTKSLDILLGCQFSSSSRSHRKRYVDSALMYICSNSRHSSEQTFTPAQITIIQKLVQHGADVNQGYRSIPFSLAVESGDFQLVELMCTYGATLERQSSGEKDMLCIAASKGHQDIIDLLLQNGTDMSEYDFTESPLDYALGNGHTECAKLLIQRGAKMDVTSALESAVKYQRPLYIRFLFENYKHEIMDCFSKETVNARELLILAVEKGNTEIIGHILDAGVDVNVTGFYEKTPLMASENRAVAEFLIQRGADVSHLVEGRNGRETPLLSHMISRKYTSASLVEVCKVLIDNGASVNCRSGDGKTPLMMAASRDSCVSLLQMLLDNGADVNDKDNEGNTALLHAITEQCFKNVSCLIDFTRDKTNVINIQNNEGLTPLIVSVKEGSLAIMKRLIEGGSDVNIRDDNENTALHHLLIDCPRDSDEMLTSLLKAGSHVNFQNRDSLSPLMLTARKPKASLMSKLLDAGADINAVSKNNNSQTVISFLPGIPYFQYETILCIKTLLHKDVRSSYLNHEYFFKLMLQNEIHIIFKLIQHGVGPADIGANKIPWRTTRVGLPTTLSPLCLALLCGNIKLAQYFVDILFLTSSDLSMFASNRAMVCLLKKEDQMQSWEFVQELSSQPMSLDKLCLVAVSTAVGSSPGRETRLDSLPLPQMMKDRLRFKSMIDEDLALSKLRPEPNTYLVSLVRGKIEILRYDESDDDFICESQLSCYDEDKFFSDSD